VKAYLSWPATGHTRPACILIHPPSSGVLADVSRNNLGMD
jgi:hypothetical protein